ncbi:MAG: BPL-N domain-containing protein [Methanobacterium sp.]
MVGASRSLIPDIKPKDNRNMMKIKISLVIVLVVSCLSLGVGLVLGEDSTETDYKVVKVLVYSGTDTSNISIEQIKKCIDQSNLENMTPGVKFVYDTSKVINSKTLSGYDVLIMAGSETGFNYINNDDVNVADLKSFVASGKGFMGICAGAYSAANYTAYWDNGWGLAPSIVNLPYLEKGNVTIQATSEGTGIIGKDGRMISHINGPAMHISGYGAVTFATYTDYNSKYNGYAAIVGDHYGEGRIVLSGVHPELSPQQADLFAKLIMWAYNGSYVKDARD